jgi:splicing factor 1
MALKRDRQDFYITYTDNDDIAKKDASRGRTSTRKRRSRWQPQDEHFASSLSAVPKNLPAGLTIEQQECLATRIRIEELTRKILINDVDMEFFTEREASPEPIYDNHGKRINTKDLRAKDKLIEERQFLVEVAFTMNPKFKPPADYNPAPVKKNRKIYIPVDKYPDYNFFGLIIGPRGNTQKKLEKETGCRIAIRGKGSVKEGKSKKDAVPNPGDEDRLHVLLTADNEVQLDRATKVIEELLVPVDEGKNEWKRAQLRELAEINGTLRDRMWMQPETPSFERATVKCEICGDASHPTSDCSFKNKEVPLPPSQKEAMANEYDKFLTEIGGNSDSKQDAYDEFMAAIAGTNTSSESREAQAASNAPVPPWAQGAQSLPPWQQQPGGAPPAPWAQPGPPGATPAAGMPPPWMAGAYPPPPHYPPWPPQ